MEVLQSLDRRQASSGKLASPSADAPALGPTVSSHTQPCDCCEAEERGSPPSNQARRSLQYEEGVGERVLQLADMRDATAVSQRIDTPPNQETRRQISPATSDQADECGTCGDPGGSNSVPASPSVHAPLAMYFSRAGAEAGAAAAAAAAAAANLAAAEVGMSPAKRLLLPWLASGCEDTARKGAPPSPSPCSPSPETCSAIKVSRQPRSCLLRVLQGSPFGAYAPGQSATPSQGGSPPSTPERRPWSNGGGAGSASALRAVIGDPAAFAQQCDFCSLRATNPEKRADLLGARPPHAPQGDHAFLPPQRSFVRLARTPRTNPATLVWRLSPSPRHAPLRAPASEEGVAELVCVWMSARRHSAAVQQSACRCLRALCPEAYGEDSCGRRKIAAAGGIRAVCAAMQAHADNPDVQASPPSSPPLHPKRHPWPLASAEAAHD